MSMTLGEKLRQAREARGFTLSEVAEQTRISSLYLESIENDDYRKLPGGIFNKGFVKSFAKFVGIPEQEALNDYSHLMAQANLAEEAELKLYKPEVLTDDRSGPSMMPTIIIAAVILGLMTGGILFLVNYLRQPSEETLVNAPSRSAANPTPATPVNDVSTAGDVPEMSSLKVEFKATTRPVPLRAIVDGAESNNAIAAGSSQIFEPKETLVLNYSRWNSPVVEMTINGKAIVLPGEPLAAADKDRIIFTISKDNLAQIWTRGAISAESPVAAPGTEANTGEPTQGVSTPVSTPTRPTPAPRPSIAANASNIAPARTPAPRPANTTRPASTPAKPAANN